MLVKSRIINAKQRDNKDGNKNKYIAEAVAKNIFMLSALIAVVSLLLIIGFVFYKGLTPFLFKGYSFIEFIIGSDWVPSADKFGISSMVVASIIATIFSTGVFACTL